MTTNGMNIYKEARQRAHMTIETAAELLNVAPRSLQHYEAGDRAVPDDVVADMMKVYNAPHLGYLHLRSSPVGRMILPEVCDTSPARCAIKTALAAEHVPGIAKMMLSIGEDNRIDRSEIEMLQKVQSKARILVGAFFSILILSGEKEKHPAATGCYRKMNVSNCRDNLHNKV